MGQTVGKRGAIVENPLTGTLLRALTDGCAESFVSPPKLEDLALDRRERGGWDDLVGSGTKRGILGVSHCAIYVIGRAVAVLLHPSLRPQGKRR
jgi:hypothetical protein